MKPRILFVTRHEEPGSGRQLALLTTSLPGDAFDVHLCLLSGDLHLKRRLANAGLPVAMIGGPGRSGGDVAVRLRRHIKRLRPDMIHTWLTSASVVTRTASIGLGVRHQIATEFGADPPPAWLSRAILSRIAQRTDRIVVSGPFVRDLCIDRGYPPDRVTIIRPAAGAMLGWGDLDIPIQPAGGFPPDGRLIAVEDRFVPGSGLKDLVWAAELLKVIRDDVHLVLFGDGPQRARIRRFCALVQIEDHVHLGSADAETLPPSLDQFDMLWQGGDRAVESCPILDAMAAGIPVVATRTAGHPQLVADGETGYLVPPGDPAAFAQTTAKLLDEGTLAARLGQAAKRRADEQWGTQRMLDEYTRLYLEVLG